MKNKLLLMKLILGLVGLGTITGFQQLELNKTYASDFNEKNASILNKFKNMLSKRSTYNALINKWKPYMDDMWKKVVDYGADEVYMYHAAETVLDAVENDINKCINDYEQLTDAYKDSIEVKECINSVIQMCIKNLNYIEENIENLDPSSHSNLIDSKIQPIKDELKNIKYNLRLDDMSLKKSSINEQLTNNNRLTKSVNLGFKNSLENSVVKKNNMIMSTKINDLEKSDKNIANEDIPKFLKKNIIKFFHIMNLICFSFNSYTDDISYFKHASDGAPKKVKNYINCIKKFQDFKQYDNLKECLSITDELVRSAINLIKDKYVCYVSNKQLLDDLIDRKYLSKDSKALVNKFNTYIDIETYLSNLSNELSNLSLYISDLDSEESEDVLFQEFKSNINNIVNGLNTKYGEIKSGVIAINKEYALNQDKNFKKNFLSCIENEISNISDFVFEEVVQIDDSHREKLKNYKDKLSNVDIQSYDYLDIIFNYLKYVEELCKQYLNNKSTDKQLNKYYDNIFKILGDIYKFANRVRTLFFIENNKNNKKILKKTLRKFDLMYNYEALKYIYDTDKEIKLNIRDVIPDIRLYIREKVNNKNSSEENINSFGESSDNKSEIAVVKDKSKRIVNKDDDVPKQAPLKKSKKRIVNKKAAIKEVNNKNSVKNVDNKDSFEENTDVKIESSKADLGKNNRDILVKERLDKLANVIRQNSNRLHQFYVKLKEKFKQKNSNNNTEIIKKLLKTFNLKFISTDVSEIIENSNSNEEAIVKLIRYISNVKSILLKTIDASSGVSKDYKEDWSVQDNRLIPYDYDLSGDDLWDNNGVVHKGTVTFLLMEFAKHFLSISGELAKLFGVEMNLNFGLNDDSDVSHFKEVDDGVILNKILNMSDTDFEKLTNNIIPQFFVMDDRNRNLKIKILEGYEDYIDMDSVNTEFRNNKPSSIDLESLYLNLIGSEE